MITGNKHLFKAHINLWN